MTQAVVLTYDPLCWRIFSHLKSPNNSAKQYDCVGFLFPKNKKHCVHCLRLGLAQSHQGAYEQHLHISPTDLKVCLVAQEKLRKVLGNISKQRLLKEFQKNATTKFSLYLQ